MWAAKANFKFSNEQKFFKIEIGKINLNNVFYIPQDI